MSVLGRQRNIRKLDQKELGELGSGFVQFLCKSIFGGAGGLLRAGSRGNSSNRANSLGAKFGPKKRRLH